MSEPAKDTYELPRSTFCGITTTGQTHAVPDPENDDTWKDLVDATAQKLHGVASQDGPPSAATYTASYKELRLTASQMTTPF